MPGGELGKNRCYWCYVEYVYLGINFITQVMNLLYIIIGPTLKQKRHVVVKKFAAQVDAMYEVAE